jgi:hypothetical protein
MGPVARSDKMGDNYLVDAFAAARGSRGSARRRRHRRGSCRRPRRPGGSTATPAVAADHARTAGPCADRWRHRCSRAGPCFCWSSCPCVDPRCVRSAFRRRAGRTPRRQQRSLLFERPGPSRRRARGARWRRRALRAGAPRARPAARLKARSHGSSALPRRSGVVSRRGRARRRASRASRARSCSCARRGPNGRASDRLRCSHGAPAGLPAAPKSRRPAPASSGGDRRRSCVAASESGSQRPRREAERATKYRIVKQNRRSWTLSKTRIRNNRRSSVLLVERLRLSARRHGAR